MARFQSGEFRTPIRFYAKISGRDEDGFPVLENKLIHETRARIKFIRGTEYHEIAGDGTVWVTFYLRFFSCIGFDENAVIEVDGDVYHITYINDIDYRHRYLEIRARKTDERIDSRLK